MVAAAAIAALPVLTLALNLDAFVPLRLVGLGRYASAPAIFLEEERGGEVLPVPIPGEAVMAVEQALSPTPPAMLEVLLHSQPVSKRDGALFDNVPWEWNPSPQAKRDAFSRFSGRGYPRDGYASPYHLVLDCLRRDGCADVSRVLIERASLLGDLVVGGCVLLERRLPQARDSGATYAMGAGPAPLEDARWWSAGNGGGDDGTAEPTVCECTTDEALGLALALGCEVLVERAVWEAAATAPRYNTQRGRMRLEVAPRTAADDEGGDVAPSGDGAARRAAPLPWELTSAEELLQLSTEDKARDPRGPSPPRPPLHAPPRPRHHPHLFHHLRHLLRPPSPPPGPLRPSGGAVAAARASRDRRGAAGAARAAAGRGHQKAAQGAPPPDLRPAPVPSARSTLQGQRRAAGA